MMTEDESNRREAALKILVRMIVRAYLGEIDRSETGPLDNLEKRKWR